MRGRGTPTSQFGGGSRGPRPVTTLRKSGQLDEAYELAREQMAAPTADDWDIADLGWCLIALVKRHAGDGDQRRLREYLEQLDRLRVPEDNDLLIEQRKRALELADGDRREVMEARRFGKENRHVEAVNAFAALWKRGSLRQDDKLAFGWELFKANQSVFRTATAKDLLPGSIETVKRNLSTYLKLGVSETGLLHTCMLQQAERLARGDHLRLVVFARMWDLSTLRAEDYRENRQTDGKVFPPLFETVVQRASKEAVSGGSPAEMRYIQPYLEDALKRYPENVWLKLNMVKLLRELGQMDEARNMATEFARTKAGEYWTWELVGDLAEDPAMRLSCYAKALTCSTDDTFVTKVRLKFAELIAADHPGEARAEVERVIEHRRREVLRVSADAERLSQASWFATASAQIASRAFYDSFKAQAEELLFSHLPWFDASVGDDFVIKGKDGEKDRSRRRIYVRGKPIPLEISVSASHPDVRRLAPGTPVKVQMETSQSEPWKTMVHRIMPRPEGSKDDVLSDCLGVIDHVNPARLLLHYIVDKGIDGTLPLANFAGIPALGDTISVRLVRYHDRNGARTRTLAATPSTQPAPSSIVKPFSEGVEVRNGMGFTSGGIFIPPDIVSAVSIENESEVEGVAVLNFDKKRSTWGWKAINCRQRQPSRP